MHRTLVIFDCDGTLVDSQHAIVTSMEHAYATVGLPCPGRAQILSIVGLSLPECFEALSPEQDLATRGELARLYKEGGVWARTGAAAVHDPLFPGAGTLVGALARRGNVVLGVATGKSKRGVARIFDREGWHPHFMTIQTADDHPSKPNPSMLMQAMVEAGIGPEHTVMIGDTSYDMAMARNAGVAALGVGWGYHDVSLLHSAGAHDVAATFDELGMHLERRCGPLEAQS